MGAVSRLRHVLRARECDDRVVNHLVLNWFFGFDWIAENELLNELIFSSDLFE